MLRQRKPEEGDTVADEKMGGLGGLVDEEPSQAPEDPRRIRDDGSIVGDDDLTWAATPTTGVVAPTVERAPVTDTLREKRGWTWGQALIVLAGLAAIVFGVGAVALGGLAGPVTAPVVDVFTFGHTPLLGLIEIGVGVVLVLTGLIRGGRWIAGPVGVASAVGGAFVLAEVEWTQTELAAEQRFGWVPIIVGSAAYLGAMVPSKKRRTRPAGSSVPFA